MARRRWILKTIGYTSSFNRHDPVGPQRSSTFHAPLVGRETATKIMGNSRMLTDTRFDGAACEITPPDGKEPKPQEKCFRYHRQRDWHGEKSSWLKPPAPSEPSQPAGTTLPSHQPRFFPVDHHVECPLRSWGSARALRRRPVCNLLDTSGSAGVYFDLAMREKSAIIPLIPPTHLRRQRLTPRISTFRYEQPAQAELSSVTRVNMV